MSDSTYQESMLPLLVFIYRVFGETCFYAGKRRRKGEDMGRPGVDPIELEFRTEEGFSLVIVFGPTRCGLPFVVSPLTSNLHHSRLIGFEFALS